MANRCASLATIERSGIKLECVPALIRKIWLAKSFNALYTAYPHAETLDKGNHDRSLRELKREAINHAAQFHGVEYLGLNKRTREDVYYLNAGDAYALTLIFSGGCLTVDTYGDIIEANRVTTREGL